ncbi:MAG: molecular chaperone TorD family protein [Armatimonadota bacterium]|nr:molecular chaperone TorD family protein [Armatimonadota bacterium]MDR7445098.1 molecular chaperone TorD family protein [Armatimonadota bacterium]MDR7569882.1 molecular chaperone TorD family protein [Armatimonadota bacterium]MDR7614183.1 molecular chaperone TorD family protein [Armatimonadota bacterium]
MTPLPDRLLLRALAYGALARLFSPFSDGEIPAEALSRLQEAVEGLEMEEPATHLRALRADAEQDPEGYRTEYLRLFVRAEAPPYEASTGTSAGASGGPNLQLLADVAGFYRAFGFEARGERPDHLAAELEFLALLCLLEARALLAGQPEEARVCAEARASFLRDHLLTWLPTFQEKVEHLTSRPALRHLVGLTVRLIQADAASAPVS